MSSASSPRLPSAKATTRRDNSPSIQRYSSPDYVLMAEPEPSEGGADIEDLSIIADPDFSATNNDDDTLGDDDDDDDGSVQSFDEVSLGAAMADDITPAKTPIAELPFRQKLMRIVNSLWWQAMVMLLILLDIIITILQVYAFYAGTDSAKELNSDDFGPHQPLTNLSLAVVVILFGEVLLRLAVLGKYFFRDILNIFDLCVMIVSFILALVVEGEVYGSFIIILRVLRVVTRVVRVVIKIVQGKRNLNKAIRHVVTENKMRYTQDGWDLDLAFITDRVMVMSLPAWDYRTLYRNHIDDVARFLDTKFPSQYIVINCCAEAYGNYPTAKFHDRVKRFLIEDHNTATLQMLFEACEYIDKWMANPTNVVVVHCKGGKGRSGSTICAYLLYSGVCSSAAEALDLFSQKRTDPTKPGRLQGVETASQKRYVDYFSRVVRAGRVLPPPVRLYLNKLTVQLVSPNNLKDSYQLAPFASITHNDGVPATNVRLLKRNEQLEAKHGFHSAEYELPERVHLVNDIRLMVFLEERRKKGNAKKREIYFFYFWFHTAFLEGPTLLLSKHEVDRNRKWKKSPFGKLKSLNVEVSFLPAGGGVNL